MNRADVRELHYITHIDNVASIMQRGILSHNEIKRLGLEHVSVAMNEIQERRRKQVPGGRRLHDYANLYFNARNPMMFKRARDAAVGTTKLVVMRVSDSVLDMPHVVIADQNASTDYVLFHASPNGLDHLKSALIFAVWWTDEDPIEQHKKRAAICAEVLVPDLVPANRIIGAYVSCEEVSAAIRPFMGPGLDISVNPHIFFL